ncbi:SIMPL domain-containing protein [Patescibacteria group bacterium]|nr:SIMPL domain-containing protein [Patescibacteria group bacterium]MBU1895717.1 SIMPL domain-containing protein [Patescibacteria group bacterium]
MPVKKTSGNLNSTAPETKSAMPTEMPKGKSCSGSHHSMFHGGGHHSMFFICKKLMMVLISILLVYIIVWFGTLIRNNIKEFSFIGEEDRSERTITVEATGEITAVPDIAVTTMGMSVLSDTVAEAQRLNTESMNSLIAELKKLNIAEEDIQTQNYNVYPSYNYTEIGQELRGYEVSQNVTIKIRDLDKANDVLSLAGEVGANSVSGLQFTIDDPDVYRQQARDEAFTKVNEKAEALSSALGVKLVKVVSYYEYDNSLSAPYRSVALDSGFGLGGGMPDIEPGSTDISLNISVTFEIR